MSHYIEAAFLDRDGTICEDHGPIRTFAELQFFPYTVKTLKDLGVLGVRVFLVSNQAAIARGLVTFDEVTSVNEQLKSYLRDRGAQLEDSLFCPHHPDGAVTKFAVKCDCRKPNPGMLIRATRQFGISLMRSIMVGDNISDVLAGQNAGCSSTILVRTGHGQRFLAQHDGPILDSLADLPEWIIQMRGA